MQASFKKLKKGQMFGQFQFFTGHSQTYCVRSKEFTKILRIERSCFLNIIKENEQDYEKFCQIKDNILLYSNYSDIGLTCKNCNQKNHLSYQCNLINIDREVCYFNVLKSQQDKQNRQIFIRKRTVKNNSFMNFMSQKDIIKVFKDQLRLTYNQEKSIQKIEAFYSLENSNLSDDEDSYQESDLQSCDLQLKKTLENFPTMKSENKYEESSSNLQQNSTGADDTKFSKRYSRKTSKQQIGSSQDEIEEIISPLEKKMHKKEPFEQLNDVVCKSENYRNTIKQSKDSTRKFPKDSYSNELDQQSKKSLKHIKRQSRRQKSNFYPQMQDYEEQIDSSKSTQRKKLAKKIEISSLKEISYFYKPSNPYQDLNFTQYQDMFLWHFDQQKEYKYYFINGNSKHQIFRYNRYIKKKAKILQQKKKKKLNIQ